MKLDNQTLAYTVFDFTPDEGSLVFFPGSLYHAVGENKSDDVRYSAGFNLKLWSDT